MDNKEISLSEMWPLMKEQIDSGKNVVFSPQGTSMLPLIRPNIDKVVLKKAPKRLKKYDLPLYLRDDGRFILHRVVGIDRDGNYIMCGDNQFEREYGVTDKQILATACAMYKGEDYLAFDDEKYKSYCKKQVLKKRIYAGYMRFKRFGSRIKHKILG